MSSTVCAGHNAYGGLGVPEMQRIGMPEGFAGKTKQMLLG
jgi:hypothetical protein